MIIYNLSSSVGITCKLHNKWCLAPPCVQFCDMSCHDGIKIMWRLSVFLVGHLILH